MTFEIDHQPMVTEIRCGNCHASVTVNTDSATLIHRKLDMFQRFHTCRNSNLRSDHILKKEKAVHAETHH